MGGRAIEGRGGRGPRRRGRVAVGLCAAALVGGCEFRIPSSTYIHETKLIAVRVEVASLGPLNPGRVGVPFESAITEVMPGDVLALEGVVIDPSGHELGGDELESIWFQCGVRSCGERGADLSEPEFDRRCDELEPPSLGVPCRVAEGGARVEFELDQLDQLDQEVVDDRVVNYYGVLAWGGRRAEDCWAERRAADTLLDRCGFVQRGVKVGPSWWLLVWAEQLGFVSPIPTWQLPVLVLAQPANRVPKAQIDVIVDGAVLGSYPEQTSFLVSLGAEIELVIGYDEIEQLTQVYFWAVPTDDGDDYWFYPGQEVVLDTVFTTGSIHTTADDQFMAKRDFVVDEYAEPGAAQIFVVYWDDRNGEGVARLDFEVEP